MVVVSWVELTSKERCNCGGWMSGLEKLLHRRASRSLRLDVTDQSLTHQGDNPNPT